MSELSLPVIFRIVCGLGIEVRVNLAQPLNAKMCFGRKVGALQRALK